jgi:hypothetical protein
MESSPRMNALSRHKLHSRPFTVIAASALVLGLAPGIAWAQDLRGRLELTDLGALSKSSSLDAFLGS